MIDRAGIAALIPHTGTMCLLDRVTHWNTRSIRCVATSHRFSQNPLLIDGRLGAVCGVEYAAQAMAVHGGLTGALTERPKSGYLASLRALTIHIDRMDDLTEDLHIEAEKLAADGSRVSYGFAVSAGGTIIVEGRAAVLLDMGDA